jgi:hypothetical protein
MRIVYSTSESGESEERAIEDRGDVLRVLKKVRQIQVGRGHPAVVLQAPDGSSLAVGLAVDRVFLMWSKADGGSLHSVGSDFGGPDFVFDYFGSYTAVPAEQTVSMNRAFHAIDNYLRRGSPEGEDLIFEFD